MAKVIRIAGNPYHPLSQEHPIDSSVPLLAKPWSNWREKAVLTLKSSAATARAAPRCWKACAVIRLLEPMKRVGKRGEGEIAHQRRLLKSLEGDDLFGEGHVDGRADSCAGYAN